MNCFLYTVNTPESSRKMRCINKLDLIWFENVVSLWHVAANLSRFTQEYSYYFLLPTVSLICLSWTTTFMFRWLQKWLDDPFGSWSIMYQATSGSFDADVCSPNKSSPSASIFTVTASGTNVLSSLEPDNHYVSRNVHPRCSCLCFPYIAPPTIFSG